MRLLVTGAAGFIGSTYVRLAMAEHDVTVLDKLTYAGRRENLPDGVELVVGGIEDRDLVMQLTEGVDAIVNFAAESHVDRSIADQDVFARTHVIGTGVLLDAARERGVGRFLQVSTDEVYGSIEEGSFTESSPLDPSSPYSATKAGGDLLVSAHAHTLRDRGGDLPRLEQLRAAPVPGEADPARASSTRCTATRCRSTATGARCATGCSSRTSAAASTRCSSVGRAGEAYNVGGPDECENIEVVRRVLELTGRDESLIEYVRDRPGHDRRYSLGSDKIREELGWEAAGALRTTASSERSSGIATTRSGGQPIRSGEYRAYYERQYGKPLG